MQDETLKTTTPDARRPAACAVCEAMLPDAVDGALGEAERRAFEGHIAGCAQCARELAEAQRGAAWLTLLKGHAPEPPAGMLERILAAVPADAQGYAPNIAPAYAPAVATPVRGPQPLRVPQIPLAALWQSAQASLQETFRGLLQPRLAMTAAMAFFSIAVTLNLTGVRLHADDFTPSGLRRTVADAGASMTRTVQNNRMVYQLESRVSELRNDDGLHRYDRIQDGPQQEERR